MTARARPASGTSWQRELETLRGERVIESRAVPGGDIGDSQRVRLQSGSTLFLKHYSGAPIGLAKCEARGLEWLARAEALRIARPMAVGQDWLALEWIESGPPAPDFDEALGTGLARLHAASPEEFGFGENNWIGRLPQPNHLRTTWAEFYATCRIEPLERRARDAGLLPLALTRNLDRVLRCLPDLVGPPEPPARLHGDLWSGNVLVDEAGAPCLIDPAVYGGHREIDLAMMRLFGGFSPRVFAAYDEAHPLEPGYENRTALYQIYPLLVHVCLFGGGYVDQLAGAVNRLAGAVDRALA